MERHVFFNITRRPNETRLVSCCPTLFERSSEGIPKECGIVSRKPSDLGDVRMKCTPDATTIAKNLDRFKKKWADIKWRGVPVIDKNTSKAPRNIRLHIEKGCLSGIPPFEQVETSGCIANLITFYIQINLVWRWRT